MRVPAPIACAVAAVLLVGAAALRAQAPLDINHATEAELDGLRGLGPATTRRILQERARAPFRDWADLAARVRGLGASSAARLQAQGVTVNGQPPPPGHTTAPPPGHTTAPPPGNAAAPPPGNAAAPPPAQ